MRQNEWANKGAEVRPWRKKLLIVGSMAVFAVAGFLWVRASGVGGGGLYCPPGPPGRSPPCVVIHESWGWIALGLVLGAICGAVLAVAILLAVRVNGKYGRWSSTEVSSSVG